MIWIGIVRIVRIFSPSRNQSIDFFMGFAKLVCCQKVFHNDIPVLRIVLYMSGIKSHPGLLPGLD